MRTWIDLELGGKTYRLVPNPKALLRVAREVGDPMNLLMEMRRVGAPAVLHVFKVVEIALAEAGHDLDQADVERLLYERGVAKLYEPYAEFLGALLNSGTVPEPRNRGERRAAAGQEKKSRKKSTGTN